MIMIFQWIQPYYNWKLIENENTSMFLFAYLSLFVQTYTGLIIFLAPLDKYKFVIFFFKWTIDRIKYVVVDNIFIQQYQATSWFKS